VSVLHNSQRSARLCPRMAYGSEWYCHETLDQTPAILTRLEPGSPAIHPTCFKRRFAPRELSVREPFGCQLPLRARVRDSLLEAEGWRTYSRLEVTYTCAVGEAMLCKSARSSCPEGLD